MSRIRNRITQPKSHIVTNCQNSDRLQIICCCHQEFDRSPFFTQGPQSTQPKSSVVDFLKGRRSTLRGKCLARNLSCLHSVYIKLEVNYSKLSHTERSRKCQQLNGHHPHRTGDQRSRHGHQPMCLCDQLTFPPATG